MKFDSLDFRLILTERARSTAAYEDWCRLRVHVSVPGFRGEFDWLATLNDLHALAAIFDDLYARTGKEFEVTYEPTEPSVAFVFRMLAHGRIEGQYAFNAVLEIGPRLEGSFQFDQSYIPAVARELADLLERAGCSVPRKA